jgi:alkanesulfonate monooxygenase SsuD/methylene tetrahydromethanopterin reductase-like flavin-dependent oxidoreductase (luciferase family)
VKLLYYSPISWPYLDARCTSFPHSNGLFDGPQGVQLYQDSLALFQLAETVGFDWLGIGEEHMNAYGVVPNPCLIASALAPITQRAALCVLGNPLPLLNPLRVAEEYAMVDVLSGGRLVAGFPRGVPQNFASYGIDPANSRARLAEAIEFVLKAWTHRGPFDWADEHYRFSQVSIWPQPTTVPDLVLSCRSPESVALAVRHRAVLAEIYVKNRQVLDHFVESCRGYHEAAQAAGWEATADRFLISVPCVIAPTGAQAEERAHGAAVYAREYISGSFEQGKQAVREQYHGSAEGLAVAAAESVADRIAYGGIICGDPATALEQILALQERTAAGVIGLQMQWGNLPSQAVAESLRLFGDHVRSRL